MDKFELANALLALNAQREQEAKDRKVQGRLDAQSRAESAAYWDAVVAAKDVEIERLEQREERLIEMAQKWAGDPDLFGSPSGPFVSALLGLQRRALGRAVLETLGVEVEK